MWACPTAEPIDQTKACCHLLADKVPALSMTNPLMPNSGDIKRQRKSSL